MSYKHILVAVDLTSESKILIHKSAKLAKSLDAEVSLIHIDPSYEDVCKQTGLLDVDLYDNCEVAVEKALTELKNLADESDYPIKHCLVGTGKFGKSLKETSEKYGIDLVVYGHHHDFMSRLFSSSQPVLNTIDVDMLVIPITKDA